MTPKDKLAIQSCIDLMIEESQNPEHYIDNRPLAAARLLFAGANNLRNLMLELHNESI